MQVWKTKPATQMEGDAGKKVVVDLGLIYRGKVGGQDDGDDAREIDLVPAEKKKET